VTIAVLGIAGVPASGVRGSLDILAPNELRFAAAEVRAREKK
jgi:hypothetical protein